MLPVPTVGAVRPSEAIAVRLVAGGGALFVSCFCVPLGATANMFLRMAWRARGVHSKLARLKHVKERLVLAELRQVSPERTTSEEMTHVWAR